MCLAEVFVFMFVFAEAPSLKCFKFVERKLQRETLCVIVNDAGLTTSVFSGTISKLHLGVSCTTGCCVFGCKII